MNNHSDFESRAKRFLLSAAVFAAVVGLCTFSQEASATTVSIGTQDTTTLPLSSFINSPVSTTGDFILSTSGSVDQHRLSPFGSGDTTNVYSAISSNNIPGSATYNLAPSATSFSFLWGSPDSFNSVSFFSGLGGTGTLLGSFTGSDLTPSNPHTGFDLVTFLASGGFIGSVVLADSGQAAFEFANVGAQTPLPAALPLYAAGVGFMGLLGWRRKRKQSLAAIAA